MKRFLVLIAISVLCWFVGTALIVNAESESVIVENNPEIETVSQYSELEIPKNDIRVGLFPGGKINNKWLSSYYKALYWEENDMIVVYGHNTKNLFAGLPEIEVGDRVVLTAVDGRQTGYEVYELKVVAPEEYEVINDPAADLILITCVGRWDEKRLVVKAFAFAG